MGKAQTLADMTRKVDKLCDLETRWNNTQDRGLGAAFSLFYHGVDGKKDRVGTILGDFVRDVLGVKSDESEARNGRCDV